MGGAATHLRLVVDDDVAHGAAVLAGRQHAADGVEHGGVLAHRHLTRERVDGLVHARHLERLGLDDRTVVPLVQEVAVLAVQRGLVRLAGAGAQQKVLVVLVIENASVRLPSTHVARRTTHLRAGSRQVDLDLRVGAEVRTCCVWAARQNVPPRGGPTGRAARLRNAIKKVSEVLRAVYLRRANAP